MDFVKRRLINAESVRLTAKAQVPRRATPGEIQPDWQAGTPQDNEGSQAVGQDRNNAADPEAGRQPYVRAAQAALEHRTGPVPRQPGNARRRCVCGLDLK